MLAQNIGSLFIFLYLPEAEPTCSHSTVLLTTTERTGCLCRYSTGLPRASSESSFCLLTGSCTELVSAKVYLMKSTEVCLHSPVPLGLVVSIFSGLLVNTYGSDFESVAPKLVSPTSPGKWFEMHILRPHPELESLWKEPSNLHLTSPEGILICSSMRITALDGRQGGLGSLPASVSGYSTAFSFTSLSTCVSLQA